MILPFLDHAIQFLPKSPFPPLSSDLMGFGISADAGFAMFHTLRSPLALCIASMSDLDLEEEACHARPRIGEGWISVDIV